jgi:hypothetical protein
VPARLRAMEKALLRMNRAGPSWNNGPLVRSPINRPSSDAVSSLTGTHSGVSGLTDCEQVVIYVMAHGSTVAGNDRGKTIK